MKRFNFNIQQFAEPGEPKTFTQEEVDKMIETRLKRENEKFEKAKKELERKHNESIEDRAKYTRAKQEFEAENAGGNE